jgi:hydrocephalus-inducing protein
MQIQCDVLVSIRSMGTAGGSRSRAIAGSDLAFDVEPSSKISIMAHSFMYATVTFHPMAIMAYSAYFEAIPDSAKGKPLTFEIYGEGNLPQVSVVRPTLHNARGHGCLLFQRLSLQSHQTLPITLKNTGTIQSTVVLEITHGRGVFEMLSTSDDPLAEVDSESEYSSPPPQGPITLQLDVGETCDCLIKFTPQVVRKYKGELWVTIKDNMFEKFPINMVGEGYEDDVIIDSIRGQVETGSTEQEEVSDDVDGEGIDIRYCLVFDCLRQR